MRPYWRTRRPCWRIRCLRTFSIWTCCAISVNNNQNDDQWDLLFIFIEVSTQYLHVNQEQNQNMIASMLPYLLRIPNKSQHINQWKNISAPFVWWKIVSFRKVNSGKVNYFLMFGSVMKNKLENIF
jgi:hypothetical protein